MDGGFFGNPVRSYLGQVLPLSKDSLASAIAVTYVVGMGAAPFLDYRGSLFFTLLALYFASPFVLISIFLCIAFFYTGIQAALNFRKRDSLSALRLGAPIGLAASNGLLIRYVLASLLGPSPPHWFTHGEFYHMLATGVSVLAGAVLAGLLLGVPIAALVIGVNQLNRKRWSGLRYLTVVAAGFASYAIASRTNDSLTTASCASGIQAALKAAHHEESLPRMSQSFPFGVLDKNHDIAVCMLDGPLFDAQYIAYDSADISTDRVSERLARLLNRGQCRVRARLVASSYYWISGGC